MHMRHTMKYDLEGSGKNSAETENPTVSGLPDPDLDEHDVYLFVKTRV